MRSIFTLMISFLVLLFVTGCDGGNNQDPADSADSVGTSPGSNSAEETPNQEESASFIPAIQGGGADSEEAFAAWLEEVQTGEINAVQMDGDLDWGLGYFLYYADLDSIRALAIDNMIYFALEAHRRLDTGEVTEESMSLNDRNLLAITGSLLYDSSQPLTDQVAQTEEIRAAILEHIVENQQNLSPQEAIESGNIIGVFGPPAAEAVGGKYLVYKQMSPGAEFEFLGVIMAVDVAGGQRETYNLNGWEGLAWLGDASGPFWDDLPAGTSGDPANTGEARPGVLLVSEEVYWDIAQGEAE